MKKINTLSFIILLGVSLVSCDQIKGKASKNVNLSTDKAKRSYAIGLQVGRTLKSQKVDLDVNVIAAAISDELSGKEAKMTEAQIRETMMAMREDQRKKIEEEKVMNAKAGAEYLEKNKTQEGVKTTASGLQYKHVTEGNGATPKETDKVKVHYKGTLIDGTEFDSSYKRNQPAEFNVNRVIKGWTEGLQLMKVGGKSIFYIPAELAYGAVPRPQIPANSVLVFEVELLDIVDEQKNPKTK
ncbi:MAG TPA: FKBP-type peptidyl-prolyl cis-trans isomerase [Oligoflexia bacterium]|nr:FKBP-type peptidyl-prolyl cis-trans isomerase [Oligoflexia bacterium]HMR23871.1 FKBP-type peptidyl-prolyl cis-trans isomerase [Oligoflexia bacterium]